ncbi:MAG: tetratricopeptide repeat protein [Kiritimatiellaeota bacterium]|nr:tetratricopeptide repeat protein [Kiritimatiellota bacterium]
MQARPVTPDGNRASKGPSPLPALTGLLLWAAGCAPIDVSQVLRQAEDAARGGAWEMAMGLTDQALAVRENDIEALVLKGICLQKCGRIDDAATILERAALLAPDTYTAQLFYGWVLAEQGLYEKALDPLEKAWELKPGGRDLMALLARCCLEQNLERGLHYLQGLRRYPSLARGPEIYNDLGVLRLKLGDAQAGLKWLLKALGRAPDNPVVLQNLAVVYDHYLVNPEQALRFYRDCLRTSQKRGDRLRVRRITDRLRALAAERRAEQRNAEQGG